MEMKEEEEVYSTDGMVCPYCGNIHDFWDFETSKYFEDGSFFCCNCNKEFSSNCHPSYSWTTRKIERD